ncbi:Crp/Fnr family transcriptional regulator [Mucilaginibacter jinjuensis]|uniref:Crp/Fnr family transcriptional regulator n=1 Tax=Mucilaginibacter jinjuensis TaxID=1176721 RepID=A0ABY7T6G3_9SPHI|nr:Crp/Fnr family transcriptional regulator [Mucilaginibacter jinjuensis]WCT12074.1 Crp/Fnr family transcriptional regulator [Mucilaginibacter jinjuensis]
MTPAELLINHIQQRVRLNPEEAELLLPYFTLKKYKKKQFVVQPDFVAKYRSYVIEGAFRAYVIGEDGEEHTIQFGIEDWWISDYNSYIFQQPATMFVVALEDSIVLQIDHESETRLKGVLPKYAEFCLITAERTAAFQQRRVINNLTLSAGQRYDKFMQQYPKVSQRIPQYALASYLGMTTQFLSRLRKKQAKS